MTDFESINHSTAALNRLFSPENNSKNNTKNNTKNNISAPLLQIIEEAVERNIFEKAIFSKPNDKTVKKTVLTLFKGNCSDIKSDIKNGNNAEMKISVMLEIFKHDGKVFHSNAEFLHLSSILERLMTENKQCDIITICGA